MTVLSGGNRRLQQEILSWILVAVLVYFLVRVVQPFLTALTWAAVLTIFLFPWHAKLEERLQRPNAAALLSVLTVTFLLVGPATWLIPAFVGEALAAVRSVDWLPRVPEIVTQFLESLAIPSADIESTVDAAVRNARGFLAEQSARLAGDVAAWTFDLIVMLFAMFYLFRDGPRVVRLIRDVSPMGGDHRDLMFRQVSELVAVTVSSGLVVAFCQGLAGGVIFWSLGIATPLFWGVVCGFLAFLPIIGPYLVWAPIAVGLLAAGETGRGILMLLLGMFVISGIDNVLRPILIAGRSQLNGLLVLVSLLGGVKTFGLVGLIVGPLVVATAVGLLQGYRESLRARSRSSRVRPAAAEAA